MKKIAILVGAWLALITWSPGGAHAAGTCPLGTATPDGCAGAQSSGSVQHTNYFSGYTGTIYKTRPPWNVAGVDYPVGHTGTLFDPTIAGALPACASYASNMMTINGDSQPCVLDHFDFSLHGGICLNITGRGGNTVKFTNDVFSANASKCPNYLIHVGGGVVTNIVGLYLDFDDNFTPSMSSDIDVTGVSNVSLQYSNFRNISCRIINTDNGSTASVNLRYNYLEGLGAGNGCHGETVEYNSATTVVMHRESYNNYYEPVSFGGDTSFAYVTSGAPGPAGPGAMTTARLSHNVMITRPTAGGGVTVSGALWVDTSFNNTISSLTMLNNWIDPAGSYFAILVDVQGANLGWIASSVCTGNMKLTAAGAAPITGTLGTGASTVLCN